MRLNPFLRRLGFTPSDRVLIIHADDVGMCGATVSGLPALFAAGTVRSASLMVPCPSFEAAATACRALPDGDFGVHLTLTSEWKTYRWAPLSTDDPASGLIDRDGYLWNLRGAVAAHADAAAVRGEMRAQVDRARQAGIDVTHLDAHMLAAMDERYIRSYAALGRELRLPLLLVREGLSRHNFDDAACTLARTVADEWEADGLPLFDHLELMGLAPPEQDRVALAKEKIDAFPRGTLGMLLLHPAVSAPDLPEIAADWQARVADQETFLRPELLDYIEATNTHVVTYRTLRDNM